jgi:uridylate kinase
VSDPGADGEPAFRRILIKVSGESLMGSLDYGTDPARLGAVAEQIKVVHERGVEIAIVLGAGTSTAASPAPPRAWIAPRRTTWGCWPSSSTRCSCRTPWRSATCHTRVQSAIEVQEVAEPYIRRRAMRHLEKGRVVIFAAGTGNPFFTSDTAARLRAVEIHAEVLLMAKNGVEGVYTADPRVDSSAEFIAEITHMEALERRLRIMDLTALTLCMENGLPIHVFNMDDERNIDRIVSGERVGTLVAT